MYRTFSLAVVLSLILAAGVLLVTSEEVKGSGFRMDSDLKDSTASFLGEDVGDNSGYSVSNAGDVNGDGFDDIIIGAYHNDDGGSEAGQTYLIFGTYSGWNMDTDLSSADASFWGEDASDRSGCSVAGAGDVDGDGYDDILIGALGDDDGGTTAGQTYLIFGKSSGWSMDTDLSAADASFWGEDADDQSGCSVAGAGDVNGDGYDDILIGAYDDDDGGTTAGQTYLIFGKSSGWSMDTDLSAANASFWGEDAGDWAGRSVSGAGDVNGDGYDDFMIGAPLNGDGGSVTGQTYLILGKVSGWAMDTDLSAADASFWGEGYSLSGNSVSGAGDVNGDGYDDILIGAYGNGDGGNGAGQTYLILGKESGWSMDNDLSNADASFWGEDSGDWSGRSVSGAGDVNGDGYDDILIGANGDDDGGTKAGQAYLILGRSTGLTMDMNLSNVSTSFWGEASNDNAGSSVSGAGDVNGDGYDDILIGAYGNGDGGNGAGQTYLIFYESKPPSPRAIDICTNREGDKIRLSWELSPYWKNISGFIISRSMDGYNYFEVGSTSATRKEFIDIDVSPSYLYSYIIETIDIRGVRSDPSDPVFIQCDLDNDVDGIGDTYDPDDDQDGLLDIFDQSPFLQDNILWSRQDCDLSLSSSSFLGEKASDYAGYSISGAGDVNGDGYDDILIGAYGNDDHESLSGKTYLMLGSETGWGNNIDLSDADASFLGEDPGDFSGWSVAGAGDVNGDGFDDILIGAPSDDDGGTSAGHSYLILGKELGWEKDTDLSYSDASFWGESSMDFSGWSVAGAGDLNGDGYDDILIGAHQDDDGGISAGQTYLIFGKGFGWNMDTDLSDADASFRGEDGEDYSGMCVAGAGDVNGDGFSDLLIGANGDDDGGSSAGQTYLIFGKASGWAMDTDLSTANASFWGEDTSDYSGYSIAGAGDVNRDGYDDILIGAYGDDDGGISAGQTYLILGKASGWAMDIDLSSVDGSFLGEEANDNSGISVAGAGDVNGDGYDDILIGAYFNDDGGTTAGQTYLILGRASGWAMDTDLSRADISFWGEDLSDNSGVCVAGAGDVDRDGYDDILIGAYHDEGGGANAGKTYVINRTILDPVQNLSVDITPTGNGFNVTWDDDIDDPFFFGIYRGTDPRGLYRLGDTTDPFFVDTDLKKGVTYYYGVVAVCPLGGESPLVISDGNLIISIDEGLVDELHSMNDSLSDSLNEIWNIVDYTNRTVLPTLNFLRNTIDQLDSSLTLKLYDIDKKLLILSNDVADLNNSLTLDLEEISRMIKMNAADLNYINSTVLNMQSKVYDTLIMIMDDMDGNYLSLQGNINDLEQEFQMRSLALMLMIESVNVTLHQEIGELDQNIEDFRSEVQDDLEELRTAMLAMGPEMVKDIEELIDDLDDTTLNEIKATLEDISLQIGGGDADILLIISDLDRRLDDFDSNTSQRIDNISSLMATMEALDGLSSDMEGVGQDLRVLQTVEQAVGDIGDEQKDTSSKLSSNKVLLWIVLIILIVLVVIQISLMVRRTMMDQKGKVMEKPERW